MGWEGEWWKGESQTREWAGLGTNAPFEHRDGNRLPGRRPMYEVIPTDRPPARVPPTADTTASPHRQSVGKHRPTVAVLSGFSVCAAVRVVSVIRIVCARPSRTGPNENGVIWVASLQVVNRLGQVYNTKSSRTISLPTDVGHFLVPVAAACKCYR